MNNNNINNKDDVSISIQEFNNEDLDSNTQKKPLIGQNNNDIENGYDEYREKENEVINLRNSLAKKSVLSEDQLEDDPAGDALRMEKNGTIKNSLNRSPAIFITMALEMIVATVIESFTDTLQTNSLLVAFMPVISAISGNVGLQSSSINVRALSLGLIHEKNMCKGVATQFYISIFMGLYSGAALGIIAGVWQQLKPTDSSDEDPSAFQGWYAVKFGVVIFFCQWLAAMSAGVFGAWSPLIFKRMKIDPGNIAGPLETAFQDIVGYTTLLFIASQIL